MLKLLKRLSFRVFVYFTLTILGAFYYLELQEPTFINNVLFGVFSFSLLVSCAIEFKIVLTHFLHSSSNDEK